MTVLKHTALILLLLFICIGAKAADKPYADDPVYKALRDSMHESFNNAEEERFFRSVRNLEDYLLSKNDLHAYYTQRCNEIVFMMNSKKIFEAYKAARRLSQELRERKLDKEMYMAHNMLGHIYRYCGNYEAAERQFRKVIELMEESGYRESMPPIYMNIVGVTEDSDPKEALKILDQAAAIANEYSPERVFDIETRRTLIYYNIGEMDKFMQGYRAYKEGEAKGLTSVHGRSVEVYYQAALGNTDKAVAMAREELGEDSYGTIASIYKDAGRWKEAYEAAYQERLSNDSIASVILTNSVEGLRDEMTLYDMERETARARTITLTVIIVLLVLLIAALTYIGLSRRRHMRQLTKAYERALESDKIKTAFIQNMSHEVRTPLNIIAGFAQVIADPDLTADSEERQDMSSMILKNTRLITNLIDEMLELSLNEAGSELKREDSVNVSAMLADIIEENGSLVEPGVKMAFEDSLPEGFTLTTNRDAVRRIVNSLLDNSIKNTTEGCITLKATAGESALTMVFEDTGCGIPPEEADRIFERFVKLDDFKEGLGLGLPLCRMLASRLNGSLLLDRSYEGPGARFVVTLPL